MFSEKITKSFHLYLKGFINDFAMTKIVNNILTVLLIISISGCRAQIKDDRGYIVKVGDMAPDFKINEAGGRSYPLSDLRGKIVMLQFTASWCSVCRTEMPFIEKEIWQAKNGSDLVVLGIDRDEPVETVLKFANEMAITYPLALDPGAGIFGLFAAKNAGVTRNVIIDSSGRIIFLTRLYNPDEFEQMKKVIFSSLTAK